MRPEFNPEVKRTIARAVAEAGDGVVHLGNSLLACTQDEGVTRQAFTAP